MHGTELHEWVELLSTNSTATSITDPVPTTTEPTGDGVIDVAAMAKSKGGFVPTNLQLAFFGTDGDGVTMLFQVTGWSKLRTVGSNTALWIPTPLAYGTATLSSSIPGVAATGIVATDLFADTIVLTFPEDTVSSHAISPADDTIATLLLDLKGHSKFEIRLGRNSSSATTNAIYRLI